MSTQRMIPVNMSHEELLAVLDDIRNRVAGGDSFEGSIQYLLPYRDEGEEEAPVNSFDVMASYRTGNTLGQGGMRMVGKWQEVKDAEDRTEERPELG